MEEVSDGTKKRPYFPEEFKRRAAERTETSGFSIMLPVVIHS